MLADLPPGLRDAVCNYGRVAWVIGDSGEVIHFGADGQVLFGEYIISSEVMEQMPKLEDMPGRFKRFVSALLS